MLAEAVTAGVRMYDYDQLKEKYGALFAEQFEIQQDTQRLYNAVTAAIQPQQKFRTLSLLQ